METLKEYAASLREEEHKVRIFLISRTEIKEQRVKAAKFILTQGDGAVKGNLGEFFNEGGVHCTALYCIDYNGKYYSGSF